MKQNVGGGGVRSTVIVEHQYWAGAPVLLNSPGLLGGGCDLLQGSHQRQLLQERRPEGLCHHGVCGV